MKIVVNKGESIENAMKSIKDFFEKDYSDYPILKNTLNLYVTLKNGEGQICPDNEKEYILSKGHAKDVFAEDKNVAFDESYTGYFDWKGRHNGLPKGYE